MAMLLAITCAALLFYVALRTLGMVWFGAEYLLNGIVDGFVLFFRMVGWTWRAFWRTLRALLGAVLWLWDAACRGALVVRMTYWPRARALCERGLARFAK